MRFFFAAALLSATLTFGAEPEYPRQGSDVFDIQADGNAQIAAALARAKSEAKRVLITLGTNWDPWSRRLHRTFVANPLINRRLAADYVLVLIDVNTRKNAKRNADLNEKYGNPIQHGLPSLIVLDPDGRVLVTQETGKFEASGHHDAEKLGAFLARWAPVRGPKL
jgi:hypothetical protein